MITALGFVAGIISVGAFVPQVVRAWRSGQTRDLSLHGMALLIAACTLWIIYGAVVRDWPVVATNGGIALLNVALVAAKLRFS